MDQRTNGPTDQQTNGPMDEESYRGAMLEPKTKPLVPSDSLNRGFDVPLMAR
jgi:hypothetical protein